MLKMILCFLFRGFEIFFWLKLDGNKFELVRDNTARKVLREPSAMQIFFGESIVLY